MRLEPLEHRRLLVATDLAAISGLVFVDVTGNGPDPGEEVAGASLQLYQDNGDGVFDASADNAVRTELTGINGGYEFSRLTAGGYFVLQDEQVVDGHRLSRQVSPLLSFDSVAVTGRIVRVVDSFDTTQQLVNDETDDGVPVTSSVAAPEAIGGERDLFVNKTSVNGSVQLSVDDPLLPDLLTFDSLRTGDGQRRVTWDGPDGDATVVDDAGLDGVDLTSANDALGLQFQIGADLAGGTAIVRLYSDDGDSTTVDRFSTATLPIPATGGGVASAEFLPFSAFTASAGGGVDISSVGAIELEISGTANVNGTAELIGTVGQTNLTQDFGTFASADLSLTKAVDNPAPSVGENVAFIVTLNNAGPDAATNVQVRDQLPAGIAFVSATESSGSYDNTTGIWTVGSVASGGVATLQLVGTTESIGTLTNVAEVSASDQFDPDSSPDPDNSQPDDGSEDDQDSAVVEPQQIDLAVAKSVDNPTPNRGDTITFSIVVSNAGPNTATGVIVRDLLPSGLSFVTFAPTDAAYNPANGNWNVGNLASGASQTLEVTARVDAVTSLSNTAEVIAATPVDVDSTPGNDVATEDDQDSALITPTTADLSLTKTASNLQPNVGDEVTFTITVNNEGPSLATGVVVAERLPAGISLVTSTASQGEYDPATGRWTAGAIGIAGSAMLELIGRVDQLGAQVNAAEVIEVDQFDPDSTPGNNVPSEDDQDTVTLNPMSIDLSLTKQVDTPRPIMGQTIAYTIAVNNAGPSDATGVLVQDILPSGVTFSAQSATTGSYDPATGLWTIGTVAAGMTVSLQLDVVVTTSEATTTNIAEVFAADQFDIDSTPADGDSTQDDQDAVSFTPAVADLALTKTVSNDVPNVGDEITFTIQLSSAGPDAASGVMVRDLLPAGVMLQSAAPSQGSYSGDTGVWDVGALPSTGTARLDLIVTVVSAGSIVNGAEVIAADQRDPDSIPNNNQPDEDDQDTIEIVGQQIDLSLMKEVDQPQPNVRDNVTFTLVVRNDGLSDATGVSVLDMLPAGLTLQSNVASQGRYAPANGIWTVGSLAVGESATLDLVLRVNEVLTVTNTAEVFAADQPDIDSTPDNGVEGEDDQASASIATLLADLQLSKTVDHDRPNVGDSVAFSVTVDNQGPDLATGVMVADLLPDGLAFESQTVSQGSYDASLGIWDVGEIASGGSALLTIVALVESSGAKVNQAEIVAADQADPDSVPGDGNPDEDDFATVTITPPLIDLSLTKTADPLRPSVGGEVLFVVTVDNDGPDEATNIEIFDQLPGGAQLGIVTPSVGQYDRASGTWFVPTLAAGGSATLELIAAVDVPGDLTNRAEVTAADQFDRDSTPGNDDGIDGNGNDEDDQAAASITTASADLSLTKTVDTVRPGVGSSVTFTLTLTNDGPDAAADLVVRDQLPAGLTFVSSQATSGGYDAATGQWALPMLAVGQSESLELVANVDTIGDKVNLAELIASSEFDPDSTPDNNVAEEDDQASVTLTPELVDLALTKTIDQPSPNVGDTIRFTIELTNDGPSTATGVQVTDQFPAGVTFDQAIASQGSFNLTTGIWTVGAVDPGQTPRLEIDAIVGDVLGATNVAEITAADQPDVDSTPGNGIADEDDQSNVSFTTAIADLSLNKTVDIAAPSKNDQITFTLTLNNAGPDAATEITVTDQLPPGLTFVDANESLGSYDPLTGRWSIDALPAGDNVTLQIVALVESQEAKTNTGEVTASRQLDLDSTPGNLDPDEDDQASVDVAPISLDVSVTAAIDNDNPELFGEIEMTFTVRNDGPIDASGVRLQVSLPPGLTLLVPQPGRGTYDPATGVWNVGRLDDGEEVELVLRATVDVRGVKRVPIEVIALDQFDVDSTPNNGDESEDDQATVVIRGPESLSKRLFLARPPRS